MPEGPVFLLGFPDSGQDRVVRTISQRADLTLTTDVDDPYLSYLPPLPDRQRDADLPAVDLHLCHRSLIEQKTLLGQTASPVARFIVCLRNPIEVAWLLYQSNRRGKLDKSKSFLEAWSRSLDQIYRPYARGRSRAIKDYAKTCYMGEILADLLTQVPAERVLFLLYDDIKMNVGGWIEDLTEFLGLEAMRVEPTHLNMTQRLQVLKSSLYRDWQLSRMPVALKQRISEIMSLDLGTISFLSKKDLSHWLC